MLRSHNIWVKIPGVEQVIMLSKQVQTRQTWTEQEREEIRAQHKLHPEYSYPVLKFGLKTNTFRLVHPHLNSEKSEQLEAVLYQEKRDIETLQGIARRAQHQSAITGYFRPRSDIS